MPLKQIIYASVLADGEDSSCVPKILRQAVENNARNGITGMLLFVNRSFLQVLEGEAGLLEPLYDKICADPRHTSPMTLGVMDIEARQFPDWSMGLADVSAEELDQIGNRNDFFSHGHCLTELDEGFARQVLTEFRGGLWRLRVN